MIYPLGTLPNSTLQYFVVTLTYLGVDYQATAVPIVHTYTPRDDLYIYNVQTYLDSINNAFAAAYALLLAANPTLVSQPPRYIYDSATQLISLIVLPDYVTLGIQVWISTEIGNRLSGFEIFFNGYYNANYKDFQLIIKDNGNNNYTYTSPVTGLTTTYLIMTQDSPQIGNMVDLQKIVFISNLPTYSENTGLLFANGDDGGALSPGSAQQKILLDFEPLVDFTTPIAAQRFQYQPALYRLISMTGDQPITNITLDIFWQNQTGALFPITLGPSRSFNVKLLFLRKDRTS
jgi:hypothetical protein